MVAFQFRRAWLRALALLALAFLAPLASGFDPRANAQDPPLDPIDPDNGEQNLLDLVEDLPINEVTTALDHFPVPYVVCATAGGVQPTCVDQRAGSPTRIDADQNKATGQGGGGQDLEVEVNTELTPEPHLRLNIIRLGTSNFASNLQVVVAFPYAAFNEETLPAPNLFFGYRTTGAFNGTVYPTGGIAPQSVEYRIIPHILGGADHLLDLQILTAGDLNPIQYLAGHFDGTSTTGVQNVLGVAALSDTPPDSMTFGLDVSQNLFSSPATATDSTFALEYTASSSSTRMIFSYLEEEAFPITGEPDFATSLSYEPMPTHLELSVNADFTTRLLTLSQSSSAPIAKMKLEHERDDGLVVTGVATQAPTEVAATLDFSGTPITALMIDVGGVGFGDPGHPNTMDIDVVATQEGGFPNTDGYLGVPVGHIQFTAVNVPDMSAGYDSLTDTFHVEATNPGEEIGLLALIAAHDSTLELPTRWAELPSPHLFSLVDTGTDFTLAARLVTVIEADLTLDSSPTGETYVLTLGTSVPLQLFLKTAPASLLTGEDIEVVCSVDDFPHGVITFEIDFPTKVEWKAVPLGQVIEDITCDGHVGTLNFSVGIGHLPSHSGYEFDPNGRLEVLVEPFGPNSDSIGFVRVRLWDETNPLPSPFSLPALLGPLHDAQLRVDQIPSFTATWSDGANTAIDFHTGVPDDNSLFVDGVQVKVSTVVELTTPLPVAAPTADDFLMFSDEGAGNPKRLGAGVFGLTDFSYLSNDGAGNMTVSYRANAAHELHIDLDSRFGGRFFPTFDYDIGFDLDSIPATWDLTTDLRTEVNFSGSSGINSAVLDGFVDDSEANGLEDRTHVQANISSLPSQFHLTVVPANSATLVTNDAGTMDLSLSLNSDESIFGTPYQLIQAALTGIPAKFNANWSGGQFLLEFKDAADNPSKLGQATATISTSNVPATNAARLAEFAQTGPDLPGVVTTDATGCRVSYTEFAQEIDRRYHSTGSPTVLPRLNLLYCDSEILDPGEDHIVAMLSGSDLTFASVQLSDLQKVAYQPDADGGHYELLIPTAGSHPLFAGAKLGSDYLVGQISNVPDSLVLDIDTSAQVIDFTASEVILEIDLYFGPLPMAGETDRALRAVIVDFPSSIHIAWGFGFPSGGVTFDASNEFEILALFQDGGGNRLVGGLELEDLHVGYFVDFPSLNGSDFVCIIPNPVPPFDCILEVPTALSIIEATAGMDNDADDPNIVANPNKPGIDGFFGLYNRIGSVAALTGSCPATCPSPGSNEYVPLLSFLMKDFKELSLSASLEVDPFPENFVIGVPPFSLDLEFPTPDLVGSFVFDVWSSADTNFTIDIDLGIGEIGFLNHPDYTENDPFHIIPFGTPVFGIDHDVVVTFDGFHGFGDHVDPFAP